VDRNPLSASPFADQFNEPDRKRDSATDESTSAVSELEQSAGIDDGTEQEPPDEQPSVDTTRGPCLDAQNHAV